MGLLNNANFNKKLEHYSSQNLLPFIKYNIWSYWNWFSDINFYHRKNLILLENKDIKKYRIIQDEDR